MEANENQYVMMPMRSNYVQQVHFDQYAHVHGTHQYDWRTKPSFNSVAKKKDDDKAKSVKGNGEVTNGERSIQSFSEINISGVFDVILTQGDKEAVSVETDSNLQEYILVENDGSSLILKNKKVKIKKSTKMVVHVTVKDLSKIQSTGVGDVTCDNTIKSNTLDLVMNNVGDTKLDLDCQTLNVTYKGVGDCILSGKATTSKIKYAGVGNLKAFDLQVGTMNITHTGVGDANIHVFQDLTLDFRGVGDVNFKGNPEKKEIKKAGVGAVKNKS